MQFYKVTALLDDAKWAEENKESRVKAARTRRIASGIEEFNCRQDRKCWAFVSDISDVDITCGVIAAAYTGEVTGVVRELLKKVSIKASELQQDETTLAQLCRLLRAAERNDFIEEDDDVLEEFNLDRISGMRSRLDYDEDLLAPTGERGTLYGAAEKLLAAETLVPELDRIYAGKNRNSARAFGHPVHYFVEADDRETREALYRTLLQGLYENGRLRSRRYCFIEFKPGERVNKKEYSALYQSCVDGTVVVRLMVNDTSDSGDDEDDDYAGSEMDTIEALCGAMLRYRGSVLTVFCLPRACAKYKKLFVDELGPVGMVTIREDLTDAAKAADYLKLLCRENHIRPDNRLRAKLDAERQYYPDELRGMFEEWYNDKIKTTVFPQYKDIEVSRREAVREVARGSAIDELNRMIGLQAAKDVITKALNYYKMQRVFKDRGVKTDRPAMHMVFSGNPGTAKTTVARLFARIMKENGLLSRGQLVEVGRSDLVAKYVGWTAKAVKDKFKAATGGVLFIDEAYSLVDDRDGSFGDEAINTIVQEMENHRDDLVVIFAGYPDKMRGFLDKNPGLRSRIAFHVPFADYDAAELCEIAKLIGSEKGVNLSEAAITKLLPLFDAARSQPDFGNGRFVRNVIELSKMNQAMRIMSIDPAKLTDRMLVSLEADDIEVPEAGAMPKKRAIGFAS